MTTPPLPEEIELHRDRMWRRDEDHRVERAVEAERFIEDVGFANTLTDARRAGPSLYIAVCSRRDVSLPRALRRRQKNEETRLTWYLKDEVMRRGRVYYAKLAGGRSMFVAPAVELGLEIVLRRERFCKSVGLVFDGFYVERLVNCLICCGYLVYSFFCGR